MGNITILWTLVGQVGCSEGGNPLRTSVATGCGEAVGAEPFVADWFLPPECVPPVQAAKDNATTPIERKRGILMQRTYTRSCRKRKFFVSKIPARASPITRTFASYKLLSGRIRNL